MVMRHVHVIGNEWLSSMLVTVRRNEESARQAFEKIIRPPCRKGCTYDHADGYKGIALLVRNGFYEMAKRELNIFLDKHPKVNRNRAHQKLVAWINAIAGIIACVEMSTRHSSPS